MTALDFPLNPSVGQTFGRWQWDGVKWVSVGAGSGGVPAAPAALFAWSNWGNMPTGQWLTQNVWNLVLNEGDWTANQNGDGFVVPEAGLYLVVLGLGTDAADVSRVILSIEGANSTGWLQETSAQRASASRVVRLAAGGEVRPFYYNRGPAITGGFTLSVVKIPEGGLPGPQGPPGPPASPRLVGVAKLVNQDTDGIGDQWVRLNAMDVVFDAKAGHTYRIMARCRFEVELSGSNGLGNLALTRGPTYDQANGLAFLRTPIGPTAPGNIRILTIEDYWGCQVDSPGQLITVFAALDNSPAGIFSHRPRPNSAESILVIEDVT
jgi:hypothetical protein